LIVNGQGWISGSEQVVEKRPFRCSAGTMAAPAIRDTRVGSQRVEVQRDIVWQRLVGSESEAIDIASHMVSGGVGGVQGQYTDLVAYPFAVGNKLSLGSLERSARQTRPTERGFHESLRVLLATSSESRRCIWDEKPRRRNVCSSVA